MNVDWVKELIGYGASLIILVSLCMTNVFRLRMINLIGSAVFGWYGWMIGSLPVCVINFVIVGIDGWYVVRVLMSSAYFELAPASSVGEGYLKRFFLYHERELLQFTPGLTLNSLLEANTCLLFRDLLPVGLFSYRQEGEEARIVTDFMIPEYRDFKAGRFVYRTKRMFFKEQGIKRFIAVTTQPQQVKYLLKNGFVRDAGDEARLVNDL
ncbi:MAG: hypothetical protein LBN38_02205 [Verrucomicrobiota bacterium]|jgi:hypothetical protein|nr:hypothetical protein [Verrucomicrobiota bacterium]